MTLRWQYNQDGIIWQDLSELYRIAPLGEKSPDDLEIVYTNSLFKCFVFSGQILVGAGRALADGRDCAYICDIAIHPDLQGQGIGKQIVQHLISQSRGHRKIILYANPGKEGFYTKLGFKRMSTAMAIFENEAEKIAAGILSES